MGIRERTEKKVFTYIEENRMIVSGDKIVAGVSGGADSVCLLELLLAYAGKVPLSLAVVHVNHGLRADAGEDAEYVEALCRREGIPFFLTEEDVRRRALEEKCSQEDAGRRVRYEAFRQAAAGMGGAKIAVAHNSNDNAETMLLHLFRGSGIKGMGGIAPVREDCTGGISIIRPILCLERREIEEYLQERGIIWRTDSTNSEDDYCRNRVRHHILPYAEREVATGVVGHMCRTAELLRETEDYLEEQTDKALSQCIISEDCCRDGMNQDIAGRNRRALDVNSFRGFHGSIQKRMLFAVIKQLSPTGKDISAVHVRDALTLFTMEGNRSVSLPFGITARREYDRVLLERVERIQPGLLESRQAAPLWQERPMGLSLGEEIFQKPLVCELGDGERIEFTAFFRKKEQELPKNRYTKWFDYDKIREYVEVRPRNKGDFLTIADSAGNMVHKSLKDYMITEKIPRQLRDRIPVVAVGNHILWLIGWRISEYFKVGGDTKCILQIKSIRADRNSETEEEDVRAH